MKSKTYLLYGISTFFLLVVIAISCTSEKVETPEVTTVTVAFVDKNLVLNGDANNVFDKGTPENSIVYVVPNGTITWELGEGLSSIEIRIDSGEAIFDVLPTPDGNGNYTAKVGNLESGEAKYSIIYALTERPSYYFVLDPVVKISSGDNP